jgi:hypothetical protein
MQKTQAELSGENLEDLYIRYIAGTTEQLQFQRDSVEA